MLDSEAEELLHKAPDTDPKKTESGQRSYSRLGSIKTHQFYCE
jgi:hypothetical protein